MEEDGHSGSKSGKACDGDVGGPASKPEEEGLREPSPNAYGWGGDHNPPGLRPPPPPLDTPGPRSAQSQPLSPALERHLHKDVDPVPPPGTDDWPSSSMVPGPWWTDPEKERLSHGRPIDAWRWHWRDDPSGDIVRAQERGADSALTLRGPGVPSGGGGGRRPGGRGPVRWCFRDLGLICGKHPQLLPTSKYSQTLPFNDLNISRAALHWKYSVCLKHSLRQLLRRDAGNRLHRRQRRLSRLRERRRRSSLQGLAQPIPRDRRRL